MSSQSNQPTTPQNNNQQASQNNNQQAGTQSTPPTLNTQNNPQNNQNQGSQAPTTVTSAPLPPTQAQNSKPAPLTLAEVKNLLVGIYNPTKIYSIPMTLDVKLTFTLNSVSITGLCYAYKYPMSIV